MLSGYDYSMTHPRRRSNRGPAAAADNRKAILEAAREVFNERGFHAPLSAVARRAGVSQGVLYRHFRNRLDLALETFESNFAEFEEMAKDPSPDLLTRMWSRLIDMTIEEAGFIEMLVEARRSVTDYDASVRMRRLLEEPLRRAIEAGIVDESVTVADLMLGPRVAFGIVATTTDGDAVGVRETVARAMEVGGMLGRLL